MEIDKTIPVNDDPNANGSGIMTYGDLIIIQNENINGPLQASGFSNMNVLAQKDNFGTSTFCRNSRDFVFQIQPKMNFDARKDYRQTVKFYLTNVVPKQGDEDSKKPDPKKADNQKQMMKQQQEQTSYKKKLSQLKKKMLDEEDSNKKLVERMKTEQVTYGSVIQMVHIESESYLCAKKICAEIDKTCNKIELIDKPSQAIYFKIMPRYKYRTEGEKIKYGDQIIFLNLKVNLYLHVSEIQIPIELPRPLPILKGTTKNEITPIKIDRRGPPGNYVPTYEVNVSSTFSRFRAIPFCRFEDDDKKFVRGGCVVQLKHSEIGGLLASDDNDFSKQQNLKEVFLWTYKGKEDDVENFNTQSLFEIELAHNYYKGNIGRTSEDVKYQQRYRLRHLNTGRLLVVQEIIHGGSKIKTLGLADHLNLELDAKPVKVGDNYRIKNAQQIKELEENSLFSFMSTNIDDDSRMKNFSCVMIQHIKSKLFVTMKKNAHFTLLEKEEKAEQEDQGPDYLGKLYIPLADEDINNARRIVIELVASAGAEDAFFVQILEREKLKDIIYVHTSVGILSKNIPYLCMEQIPKERFQIIETMLKKLNAFAQCEEKAGDLSIEGEDSGAAGFDMNTLRDKIVKRQKIMRELYLVEYLVQALYFPFATKTFDLANITQDDFITRICQHAYVLLLNACGGYEMNEMYASQWINFFFGQTMKTHSENDINASTTVEELLSDNQKLLEEQITPTIVKQFINLCKTQEKDKKLIMLLTAMCICNGEQIEHNQLQIVKFLLEDRNTRDKLMMPVRIRDKQIEVKIEGTAYISLVSLADYSKGRDGGRIFKYFKSLVDLAANLNIGRNQHSYQQLSSIFGFEPVFQIIYDSSLPFDIRSFFLKLMNSMYLNREPLEPLEIPTTTVVMNEIPAFSDLVPDHQSITYKLQSSKVDIPQSLIKFKDFILSFLIQENGVQDLDNKKKNKFVNNMILSLHFMITHGFYATQEELNAIVFPLIMLLDGSDDVYEDGDPTDRYKYTGKNEIILMSKKVQCDCLIFISQLELDGRAELFLSKLKLEYESSVVKQKDTLGKSLIKRRSSQALIPQLQEGDIQSLEQLKVNGADLLQSIGQQAAESEKEGASSLLSQSNIEFLETVASMKGFESGTGDVYICILFDLMLYKYPELNQVAFELLVRYFNRKASLLESLCNIQILESQKSIEILHKVITYKAQLQAFQSDSDLFMNDVDKNASEQKLQVEEVFTFLTRYCSVLTPKTPDSPFKSPRKSLKTEEAVNLKDLLAKLNDDEYVKEHLKPEENSFTAEQEDFLLFMKLPPQENKENQTLMNNFGMQFFAIYFIKYRTEESASQTPEHIAMIKQCYRFLVKFVKGNVKNQLKLREELQYFMKDIDKHPLAIQLIFEIFKDNKKFLNLNASKILKQIVKASEKAPIDDNKKGSLFILLTAFCKCQDKLVRANQQDIVLFLSEKIAQSNIMYLFTSEGFKDISKFIQQQKQIVFPTDTKDKAKKNSDDPSSRFSTMFVTNQINNIMACVDLLALCCEGKSDVAEAKCQTEVITLENAYHIIKACEYFWPLKRKFVNYCWQTFLDSNSKTIFIDLYYGNVKLAWQIAEIVLNDATTIVGKLSTETDKEVYIKYPYKRGITLREESVSFLSDSILPYFKYLMKRKDIKIDSDGERIISQFTKKVLEFYYAAPDHDSKKKAYTFIGYMYNKKNLSYFLDDHRHPFQGDYPGSLVAHADSVAEIPQVVVELKTDQSESSKLTLMLHQLQNSSDVNDMIEKEFVELVDWITNIQPRSKEVVSQNSAYGVDAFQNLSFNSISSAILQMLDTRELSKKMHLFGLKIVRKLIEAENTNCLTPAADWGSDDWADCQSQVIAKQDAMIKMGTVQFLCKHIAEVDDDAYLEQCVLIGIAILIGGNSNAQQAFLVYFQEEDAYNRVLGKLKQIMIKEFDLAKTYLQEQNAKLIMNSKNQERMVQMEERKIQKLFEEEQSNKKDLEEILEELDPNAIKITEEGFDDTLENLMTLEDQNADRPSMVTNADGGGGEGKKKDEDQSSNAKEGPQSVIKVIRILRFLQLLAEGHFTPLQNHLREQKASDGELNPKSFDFVAFICSMLGVLEKQYVNCYSCNLGNQMIETLIEVIQGPCKDNQRTLVAAKVIDNCRDLISQGSTERELKLKGFQGDKIAVLDELKSKAVKLLLAIIEGPIDQDIMRSLTSTLDDFVVIFKRINYCFNGFLSNVLNLDPEQVSLSDIQSSLQKDSFDDEGIQEGFDLFVLISTLSSCNPPVKETIAPYQETLYYEFFKENVSYIEIMLSPDVIQRIFFPIKPVCRYLSKNSRTELMTGVNRTSWNEKILGLLEAVPELVAEMNHIEHLSRATIQITPDRIDFFKDISMLVAIACSTLMLIFYSYGLSYNKDNLPQIGPLINKWIELAIRVLGFVQLLTSVISLIGQLFNRGQLIIKSGWHKYGESNKLKYSTLIKNRKEQSEEVLKAWDMSLLDARMVLITEGPESEQFMDDETQAINFGHKILHLEYLWTNMSFVLSNGQIAFQIVYISLSCLGLFVSPIYYVFQLLDVVNRIPSLTNVIKAVTKNGYQLLLTAMLELIIVFVYSCILFTFFYDQQYNNNIIHTLDETGEMMCPDLWHCYVAMINFGLRSGGGFGDQLQAYSYFNADKTDYFLRAFLDLSFYMLIIQLFSQLIFGIIIDAFGTLRQERDDMLADMREFCYICNIQRQDIDKGSEEGFIYHIKKEHNLWQYVYFIIHLNTKDETEYNGVESYVMDKINDGDVSWFPSNKAICLEKEKYLIKA